MLQWINKVSIPDSVTSIGEGAFYGCDALPSVDIPGSVQTIGKDAFVCDGLLNATLGNGVTSIGESSFASCEKLSTITIPASVKSWDRAFENCGLTQATINSGVTSIGEDAFRRCSSLTSITIPDSVTSIGEGAFDGCSSLTSITIPDSVTSIGEGAFDGCSSLTSITIPDGVTSIGGYAFYGCSSLKSVTIPGSITTIPYSCFSGCTAMTEAVIQKGVVTIGEYSFENCTSLKNVTIPDGVTTIESAAFCWCDSLESLTVPASVSKMYPYSAGFIRYTGPGNTTYLIIRSGKWNYLTMKRGFVLRGYSGGAVQTYAEKNGITFVSLGTVPQPASKKSNVVSVASAFTKTVNVKKDQSFNLGASANGAALTYKSSNKKVGVKNGKVTIKKGFVGKATITITAAETDKYLPAQKQVTVTVNPSVIQLSGVKWDKKKKIANVAWKKNTTGKGYEIQYSTKKKFKKGVKTVKVKKNKTVKTTIKGLKKGTWYFRIRTVNGKLGSGWSKVKTLKIAK